MNTKFRLCFWVSISTFTLALAGAQIAPAQATGTKRIPNIAENRQLFVDHSLIEHMDNVSLRLHEPVSGGVAIKLDKDANDGSIVIRDGGRYLMYYLALPYKKGDRMGALSVATSKDGITWTKPALGLVELNGRRDNNLVADETGQPLLMVHPWLDTRPDTPKNERFKAFASEPISGEKHTQFGDPKGPKRLVFWSSADGFTFRKLEKQPKLVSRMKNCFDGGNTMFWSETEQSYVLYYRFYDGYRSVVRTTSKDFLHWTDSVPMTYGDTPREGIYTNNTIPYFRAPQIYVALAARYMAGRRVLTDKQQRDIGVKSLYGRPYPNDCSDCVLMTTRAGSTQYDRTFMEGFVRPGPCAQNWVSRTNFPLTGIFPCGQNQMMFWVKRHNMQDTGHHERMLLRLDGFTSVNAPYAGGELLTKPFIFSGNQLEINYSTSAAGSLRVEIQDAAGKPIPGYTLDECKEIIGDEVDRVVTWKQNADVSPCAGKPVRLKFTLKDADLYSFKFQKNNTESE